MKRQEYEDICHAAFWGEKPQVENPALHEKGEVFNCKNDTFNVKVGDEWRQWGRQICVEPEAGDTKKTGQGRRRPV